MKVQMRLWLALFTLSLTNCSDESSSQGQLFDIANPGPFGSDNILIWSDQGNLYKAGCTKNAPTTRANCAISPSQIALATVTERATVQGNQQVQLFTSAITAEVKALKDADPNVRSLAEQIQSMTRQKSAVEENITEAQSDLNSLVTTKTQLEASAQYYDQQLTSIQKQLESNPRDPELLKLKAELIEEQSAIAEELAQVKSEIARVEEKLQWNQRTLETLSQTLAARQKEYAELYDALNVNSEKLTELQESLTTAASALSSIARVLELIAASDITYRGNLLNKSQNLALQWIMAVANENLLRAGRYRLASGYRFCPQRAVPNVVGGSLKSVRLTYLSPCGGLSHNYECNNGVCNGVGYNAQMILKDSTHYDFKDSGYTGSFEFESADMDAPSVEGGPLLAIAE